MFPQCAIRCCLARRKLKKLKQDAKELGNLKDQNIQLQQEVRSLRYQVQHMQGVIVDLQQQLSTARGGAAVVIAAAPAQPVSSMTVRTLCRMQSC